MLASVAFEANIINASFYTTLVLFAVLTSQIAGAWLDYVLRKGWPLLSGEEIERETGAELRCTHEVEFGDVPLAPGAFWE